MAPEAEARTSGVMERLDFALPDFTRPSWVGDTARAVWEPRLHRVTKAWLTIEWLSVLSGVRSCGVTMVTPQEFIEQGATWAGRGLNALPVEIQGAAGSYASAGKPAVLGQPFVFRVVVGTPRSVSDFKAAWDARDNEAIGRHLGYPTCCYDFFQQVWVRGGHVDTTWPMAAATAAPAAGARDVEVSGPPEANILWRWMGARAVPHLPCRFDCVRTVELARRLMEVGRDAGFGDEIEWLQEILSWPVEWSALHGIAEIKTPILKVSTRTDATPVKYTVRRLGTGYPPEGAQGLRFPYQMPHRSPLVTLSPAFQRGLDAPIPATSPVPAWYAPDNGFPSRAAMDRAHRPIVELATAALAGSAGKVLDLGCGNGALLQKVREASPAIEPFGIDTDAGRVAHARELLPAFAGNFVAGSLFASEEIWPEGRRYALVILMPGRLLEVEPERAERLRAMLEARADRVLVYAYGDWLTRHRDLHGLARRAGFSLLSSRADVPASLAVFRANATPADRETTRSRP
ncbi:MAG: class I SAM-dependent methyltransferase [Candidatus Rokuibacteriota bacterium]